MNTLVLAEKRNVTLHHDKTTDVAYVDILPAPESGQVCVIDVSEAMGLNATVLGRFDEDGNLLGLTIESYRRFRREVMRKYLALAVERILDLLVDRVRTTFSHTQSEKHSFLASAH